jgi:hypothetical protein
MEVKKYAVKQATVQPDGNCFIPEGAIVVGVMLSGANYQVIFLYPSDEWDKLFPDEKNKPEADKTTEADAPNEPKPQLG